MEPSVFSDVRVLELTGILGQQCGKLFADMGADVIRVEPPGGAESRRIGPFLSDVPHRDRSLSFWHYNTSKRSITLDLACPTGAAIFRRLVATTDVLVEDQPPGALPALGLGYEQLQALRPGLIMVSITPFGQTGPYRDLKSSDLVSLALGGPLWSCGYDDHGLPPARPYTDAAYHIACHYAFVGVVAALVLRQATGQGQYLDVSMHEACHDTTEGAMPTYYFGGQRVQRQTGRHAAVTATQPVLFPCRDGKWIFTRVPVEPNAWEQFLDWLDEAGMAVDLRDQRFSDPARRQQEIAHITEVLASFCATHTADELYHGAQRRGMVWATVRSPDEVVHDQHLKARGFVVSVEHPELGRSFQYAGAPYQFSETPWAIRKRAPLLGEHNQEVYCREMGFTPAELVALSEAGVV
ncbi:MAG: CoA transferase [Chloroflexi bacterium]|nr:CoA transferase [Chloroflexota bacterium]